MTKLEFLTALHPVAATIQRAYGIQSIILYGQALHESTHSDNPFTLSRLATEAGNLFGVTAEGSWDTLKRPVLDLGTDEQKPDGTVYRVRRPFRRYASWDDSCYDWARIILLPHYRPAFEAACDGNPDLFGKMIREGGYATDLAYAPAVANRIREAAAILGVSLT